jgi:hypothetical protein
VGLYHAKKSGGTLLEMGRKKITATAITYEINTNTAAQRSAFLRGLIKFTDDRSLA